MFRATASSAWLQTRERWEQPLGGRLFTQQGFPEAYCVPGTVRLPRGTGSHKQAQSRAHAEGCRDRSEAVSGRMRECVPVCGAVGPT